MNRLSDLVTAGEEQDRADLIHRIMAGDRQAEAELVEHYHRGIRFIIRQGISDAVAADDLYQEAFRVALEKIRHGDVREPERLSGFMCSLARNLVISYCRRATRQESLTEIEEAHSALHSAPRQLEELLQREKARIVRQVINELKSDRDRQVLLRFYIAEEEKERICTDLGLSSLHFNRVLFRARGRYKGLYEQVVKGR